MSIARITAITGLFVAATLAGCAARSGNDSLAGTWQGRADDARPFTFGSVTFAGDGTYTAEAKYGDTTRVQTGRFSSPTTAWCSTEAGPTTSTSRAMRSSSPIRPPETR